MTPELKRAVDNFAMQDDSLQQLTFDCVAAISVSCLLLNQFYRSFEHGNAMREQSARGRTIREEMQARKEFQEYLYLYIDNLASSDGLPKDKYNDNLTKACELLRKIQIEMN